MLKIIIQETEEWDEIHNEFKYQDGIVLHLEHSLISISKWESAWNKPFLTDDTKSLDEIMDYVKYMSISEEINDAMLSRLSSENIKEINKYISAPMTATWFCEKKGSGLNSEIVTSEIIYYWMVALNIPFECQYWHLNRLLTLIKVCNIKNQPSKKMSNDEILRRNAALNEERKKRWASGGDKNI